MKKLCLILSLIGMVCFMQINLMAQSYTKPSVLRIDTDAQFPEKNQFKNIQQNQSPNVKEDFTYYTTSSGIYISFKNTNNDVRLFALTGQVLWSGELVSGKFFIPTGEGIFFLRVNNKTHKISCK